MSLRLGLLTVVILLVLGGIYLFSQSSIFPEKITSPLQQGVMSTVAPSLSPSFSASASAAKAAVKSTTEKFFADYMDCLTASGSAATTSSVSCQVKNQYTSTEFIINLSNAGVGKKGTDPVFCAQSVPSKIVVTAVDLTSPQKAAATVSEILAEGLAQAEIVTVRSVKSVWKVDAITCPKM